MKITDGTHFTTCFRVDSSVGGTQVTHPHVTITYLGTEAPMDEVIAAIDQLAELINTKKPGACFRVTGHDMFGPCCDIPVSRVEITDPEVLAATVAIHQRYGVLSPGFDEKLEVPNFHISNVLLEVGSSLSPQALTIKPIGPHDPIHRKSLSAQRLPLPSERANPDRPTAKELEAEGHRCLLWAESIPLQLAGWCHKHPCVEKDQ